MGFQGRDHCGGVQAIGRAQFRKAHSAGTRFTLGANVFRDDSSACPYGGSPYFAAPESLMALFSSRTQENGGGDMKGAGYGQYADQKGHVEGRGEYLHLPCAVLEIGQEWSPIIVDMFVQRRRDKALRYNEIRFGFVCIITTGSFDCVNVQTPFIMPNWH